MSIYEPTLPPNDLAPEPDEASAPQMAPAPTRHTNGKPERIPRPQGVIDKIVWPYAIAFVLFHLALPLAFVPWLFSWTGLLLIPIGNYVFCSTGIGLCYHRTLTHRGLVMPKWLERTLATLGVCSLMDSPARWVAIHRLHHQHSDRQPDPHTPRAGFWWSHFEWLIKENTDLSTIDAYDRYARDVLRDRYYFNIERYHLWFWIYVAHAAVFFLAGLAIGWATTGEYIGGLQFGLSLLLWGVVYRTIYTWHITWAVNSVTHCYGYRNYETSDDSRNQWLVALATNGEGWHNNHHADPRSAAHGHRWWEIDVTWATIRLLRLLGLAKDVVPPRVKTSKQPPG